MTPLDTCSSLLTLYRERNTTDLATGTIYTLALMYQLHLHGLEERLYQRCIDSRVQEQAYCQQSIVPYLQNLTLWREDNKLKACTEAQRYTTDKCAQGECSPCALTIGYLFAKYEKHVETSIRTVFEAISKGIA